MENLIEKEELIRNCLEQGDREAAIKLLFDLVVDCAKEKNFEAAEAMRSRIFEIDAMALSQIIRSGEVIEEEKSRTIGRGHREIWGKLYDSLTAEETNALYFALKNATYQAEGKIFQQDELKPRLYFINSGRARVVYFLDGQEVFLRAVETGELAGEDTFFRLSMCTTTMIAQCTAEVSYLDSDILKVWRTTFPMLESKLQSFASSAEKIADLLKARKLDRRRLRRFNPGGKATALLMNTSGQPVGKPFKVDLCDISRGGTCFFVKIAKKESAGLLLGKRLYISYLHPLMDSSHTLRQSGTIVAVHFNPFEDCAVNVEFDALLPKELIEQLEKLSPPSMAFDF